MAIITTILGICGNIAAFVLFLVPAKTFYTIVTKKSTEEFSGIPYVTTLMNNFLWVLYGLPVNKGNVLVMTINGAGIVIQTVYILIFLIFASTQRGRLKVLGLFLADILATVALGLGIIMGIHDKNARIKILGVLCVVFNIAMYYAPLSVMFLVIKTKSTKFMPFLLSLMVLVNSTFWTIYGFLLHDIYIIIPNGLGLVGGIFQMILYACYHKSTPAVDEEAPAPKDKGDFEMGRFEHKQTSS